MAGAGLLHYVNVSRDKLTSPKKAIRVVYRSELIGEVPGKPGKLHAYVADKTPLFYRKVESIASRMQDGYFLSAITETLEKLPTAPSFQNSHCGEIMAGIFAEEVLNLRTLYKKLSLLSTQNANGNNMDLVMYDPASSPLEFVF